MNSKRIKIAMVFAALVAFLGLSLSNQYVPAAWAKDAPKGLKMAKERGLFKMPAEHRQHAVSWALMKEIRTKLGKEKAQEIKKAETPSELHAYLQGVVNTCKRKEVKCPVSKALLGGFNGKGKKLEGKHYGEEIHKSAKSFDAEAHCVPEPEP